MYGFVYVTINLVNNRKYVGRRKYSQGWEDYLGSGKLLGQAISRYGKEKFKRVILEDFLTEELMLMGEKFYIQEFLNFGEDLYNISSGGLDGFTTKFNPMNADANRQNQSERMKNRVHEDDYVERYNLSHPGDSNPSKRLDVRQKISDNNPMKNPEHVKKISGDNHYMRDKTSEGYVKCMDFLKNQNPMWDERVKALHRERMTGEGNPLNDPEIRRRYDEGRRKYMESGRLAENAKRRSRKLLVNTDGGFMLFESVDDFSKFFGWSSSTADQYLRAGKPYNGLVLKPIGKDLFYSVISSGSGQKLAEGSYFFKRIPILKRGERNA